jgi:hypothetical protein
MEAAIAGLVQRFEQGALSRRELIQGLSMLALGVAAVPAAAQQPTGLKATGLNHLGCCAATSIAPPRSTSTRSA